MDEKEVFGEEFGEVLRELRIKLGLTQADLAEILDMDEKHLGKIERGKKTPKFARPLYNLFTKTDVSLDEMYTELQKRLKNNKENK